MANALTEALDSLVAGRIDGNGQTRKDLVKVVVDEQKSELLRYKSETVMLLEQNLAAAIARSAPAAVITAQERLLNQASQG